MRLPQTDSDPLYPVSLYHRVPDSWRTVLVRAETFVIFGLLVWAANTPWFGGYKQGSGRIPTFVFYAKLESDSTAMDGAGWYTASLLMLIPLLLVTLLRPYRMVAGLAGLAAAVSGLIALKIQPNPELTDAVDWTDLGVNSVMTFALVTYAALQLFRLLFVRDEERREIVWFFLD